VSCRHVLRKVVRCVKFIFGLDTDVARVQNEHKFPLGGISATRVSRVHPECIEHATRDTRMNLFIMFVFVQKIYIVETEQSLLLNNYSFIHSRLTKI